MSGTGHQQRRAGDLHVVIAGSGFAAVEAMLALSAQGGDRVTLTLVSPEARFVCRPVAPQEVFGETRPQRHDLQTIMSDLGVRYRRGRLEAVAPEQRWIRMTSGARVPYDALILAIGARARVAIPGALTFRDQRDAPLLRRVLEDLDQDRIRSLVFALPAGGSWPLLAYESALLAGVRAQERRLDADVALVTPEKRPLEVFGAEVSGVVGDLLAQRSVRFIGGSAPRVVTRQGLTLESGTTIAADRAVAAPQLRGQRITGIPRDHLGMISTDRSCLVHGLRDVYAVGDITSFTIKHGGLATQQADRAVAAILRANGLPAAEPAPFDLRMQLSDAMRPLSLRAELDERGRVISASVQDGRPLPHGKVHGRYLSPYLEALAPETTAA
ncbi:MAG TPA: FAD-dependent oxidoreductase [Solirubrobacteraceae bacterium]|nr:FAD-dependent oxidoreductase [Solirubrobacteraceae bacterium]